MKATIGVYGNHDLAMDAVMELNLAGYPLKHVTIMGLSETETLDEKLHVITQSPVKLSGLAAGTVVGTAAGVLTGIGMFAIPGLGVLYGAGALVGAIAGFDFGIIGGGLLSVVSTIGLQKHVEKKYHDELVAGKYLLIIHGSHDEVDDAVSILAHHAKHTSLETHASFFKSLMDSYDGHYPLAGS